MLANPTRMESKGEIKQISQLEFVKLKDAWTGSKVPQTVELWALKSCQEDAFQCQKLKFSPALNKLIDEIVVNALDQWTKHPRLVKNIHLRMGTLKELNLEWTNVGNPSDMVIQVFNDGPGIPIKKTKNINQVSMYSVQMICAEFHSGTNFDSEDRITGGTNGAGIKLTNAYSEFMAIETWDGKKHYRQVFRDRLNIVDEPSVEKSSEKNGTRVSFLLDYKILGEPKKELVELLLKTRAWQAAAFTNAQVKYNDQRLQIPEPGGLLGFASMFGFKPEQMLHTTLKNATDKGPFNTDLEIVVTPSDGRFRQVSLLNGVYAHEGGNHIVHLSNLIVGALKPLTEKEIKKTKAKFNPNYVLNLMFVFVKGNVVNASWNGNIKSHLDSPMEQFEPYQFDKKQFIKQLWNQFGDAIVAQFNLKLTGAKKTRVNRGTVDVPKAVDAQLAGKVRDASKCTLIICEGDSANGTVKEGILKVLKYQHYGTFNIQGVPINVRKEASVKKSGDEITKVPGKRLLQNERFTSLMKILGLDFNKTYQTDAEFQTLRYGSVVVATDQDEDGKGNIFGLILNIFVFFWPNLVKRGFLQRLNTPIIRAIPKASKGFIEEFYTLKQFKTWLDSKFNSDEKAVTSKYTIEYYKGLGSHEKDEAVQIFKKFKEQLFVIQWTEESEKDAEIFFGKETANRKLVLATPVELPEPEGPLVSVSTQLYTDTKSYQRDNILRKLPHLVDGLVPSRRGVLYGAKKAFAGPKRNIKLKLSAFIGEVTRTVHYHHGEASLESTAKKMAQNFPGARNIPLLDPCGQFGTRAAGGKDAASARYIKTCINQVALEIFPPKDDWLLKYKFDDGYRCEPEYFVPIIPMAILENVSIPATGWKNKMWARDINQVFQNIKDLLSGTIKKPRKMDLWLHRNKSELRTYKKKLYSFGTYKVRASLNELVVTELPLGVFSYQIIGMDAHGKIPMRDEYAKLPLDETCDEEVKITFFFKSGMLEYIKENYGDAEQDCFEAYLDLKNLLDEHINVIGPSGEVLELSKGRKDGYRHIFKMWFEERASLYAKRIDRELYLTQMRILKLENQKRFVSLYSQYGARSMKLNELEALLLKEKYDRFLVSRLEQPKFATLEELKVEVLGGPESSYDYLIDLRCRDMTQEACKKRDEALLEEKKYLQELEDDCKGSFKGCKTWLRELESLEKLIGKGLTLGWTFGAKKPNYR